MEQYPPEGKEIRTCKECKYYTTKWKLLDGRPPGPRGTYYAIPYCKAKGEWLWHTMSGKPSWCPLPIYVPTTLKEKLKEKLMEFLTFVLVIVLFICFIYLSCLILKFITDIFK